MKRMIALCALLICMVMILPLTAFAGDIPESLLYEEGAQIFFGEVLSYHPDKKNPDIELSPVAGIKGDVKEGSKQTYSNPNPIGDFKVREGKVVNSNPSIRAIQSLISSEWWAEGNPACDNDYKITVNDESYWYHSDCGTLTDINHDSCITLNESQKAAMAVLIEVGQDSDFNRYWLTVGEDGVKRIEIKTAYSSGGCENADGSLYQKGDRIWLECLDGFLDLRGVSLLHWTKPDRSFGRHLFLMVRIMKALPI